jgi:primary-amine oxidase
MTTNVGNKRGFQIVPPTSPAQMLPEHNKFLHLQNFTKCDIAVTKFNAADEYAVPPAVFGNLYPLPALPGHDISHFFNDESLENVDLVFYIHNTKFHFPRTEDVPVPTTMGKPISFEPYNYNMDDVGTFKHLPESMYRFNQRVGRSSARREGIPVEQCVA